MRRDWTIGPVFVLRHAGMPFDWLEGLGAGADVLAAARDVLDRGDELLAATASAGKLSRRVGEAVRRLAPDLLPVGPGAPWRPAADRWRDAADRYLACFDAAQREASDGLAALLDRPEVREAVFLSNPSVYRNMLLPFLARTAPLNAARRRARRQLYTYVQRFCAKNETVSFFGPMAYGRVVPGDRAVLRTDLPRRRAVFLSSWAAREIARAVAADRRLRAFLPFRPTGRPGGDRADRELLAALPARGAALRAIASASGTPVREVAERLARLVERGVVEFGVAAAPYDLDPLRTMSETLGELPASAARDAWLSALARLRALLAELERTPFPERIAVVDRLEAAFTAATGQPARRGGGAVYADRAVFYEECSSPFALTLGEEIVERWQRALTAALELSAAHGARAQEAARARVVDCLGTGAELAFRAYAERLLPAFDPGGSRFTSDHVPAYPAPDAARHIEALLAAAARLPGDRFALVDLCPAASRPSELAGAELIVSRCHHHLLTDGWLATMAADRAEFGRAAAAWIARRPHLVGLDSGRRNKGYYLFPGRRLALRAASHADADGVLWPEEITVAVSAPDRTLGAHGPDGGAVTLYIPLSDHTKYPPYAALSEPQVAHATFEPDKRRPGETAATAAVRAGTVVYQRRRWTLDADALSAGTPATRFLALRRFAAESGAGRFVFCRTERERKPYLVDLESVLAADLLAGVAGHTDVLSAEEMRPGPGELWLRDADGRRYTCELRAQVIGTDRTGEER
ncbi:lantibiotic dehydratase [Streptomyces litchfieldiae]|uniref:Lantibiotic dehydratase n=1 Tax=Streptomyces litchfieldiae TaxID=3075543 RepID=A0ABU2MPR9_9ACTN|nr:lantibiotic dehydratase [Streptomyces sp. DSM 44938]MDT0343610.1 lantibiotic dehydratase [Streptomyces sp. DSM 44938]